MPGGGVYLTVNFTGSADGRYVAFLSDAANYVANDSNGAVDVFVRDTVLGTTTLASIDRFGNVSNTGSSGYAIPTLSADGRYVTFSSTSPDLTTVDPNGGCLAYVRDLQDGVTTAVSVKPDGTIPGYTGAYDPVISADGRTIVFRESTNLVAPDANSYYDVYAYDQSSRSLTLVSVTADGSNGGDAESGTNIYLGPPRLAVSADGRFVFFRTAATNLVDGVTITGQNLYRRDLFNQTTLLISTNPGGSASGNDDSDTTAISADGRFVAFESFASNLMTGDTNYRQDVFVRDLSLDSTSLASLRSPNLPAVVFAVNGASLECSTPDGRYVVFTAVDGVRSSYNYPSDYRPDIDAAYTTHIFVRDTQTGAVSFVDLNPAGTRAWEELFPRSARTGATCTLCRVPTSMTPIPTTTPGRSSCATWRPASPPWCRDQLPVLPRPARSATGESWPSVPMAVMSSGTAGGLAVPTWSRA